MTMTKLGGFICAKNALFALNFVYILIGIILISVGAYAHQSSIVSSVSVAGGIIAVGVFLALVALLGLFGSLKHHQVALFFYMIILFAIFIVQFFVAVACLALNEETIDKLVITGWKQSSNATRMDAQKNFDCCGLTETIDPAGVQCAKLNLSCSPVTDCPKCLPRIIQKSEYAAQVAGGVGLFFSFSEIIGIWLAMRFRNLKNPRADPESYLS